MMASCKEQFLMVARNGALIASAGDPDWIPKKILYYTLFPGTDSAICTYTVDLYNMHNFPNLQPIPSRIALGVGRRIRRQKAHNHLIGIFCHPALRILANRVDMLDTAVDDELTLASNIETQEGLTQVVRISH
jgi:hypothetical protein